MTAPSVSMPTVVGARLEYDDKNPTKHNLVGFSFMQRKVTL